MPSLCCRMCRSSRPLLLLSLICSPALADHGAVVQLEQVDVQAVQYVLPEQAAIEQQQSLTPGGIDSVDSKTLQNRSLHNLADALRYVPGVVAESTTGGSDLRLSIRGSNLDATDYDNNGVLLLQDGLPVTAADGNNHNRFIDADNSRFITVARGANAIGFGASTLGGAIDAVSKTALNSDARELSLQGGSHGAVSGSATLGGVKGNWDGLVKMERKLWDGYREHSKLRRNSLDANLGWQASEQLEWRFYFTHVDSQQQLTSALTRAQFEADPEQAGGNAEAGNYQKNVESNRLASKATWYIDANSKLEFGVSYEQQSLFHPIVYNSPGYTLLIDNQQDTSAAMVKYQLRSGKHQWLAGINLAHSQVTGGNYDNDQGHKGGKQQRLDHAADNLSLFVLDRWQLRPNWTLVYGAQGVLARRDVSKTDVATGSRENPHGDFSAINPRVGLIRKLGADSEAFASISRLYEPPTSYQLQDSVAGGDEVLDAMHGVVYETGLRGQHKGTGLHPDWRWSASVYRADMRDEILAVEDPTAPGTYLSGNTDKTLHQGAELLLAANFRLPAGQHLRPLLSASWNDFSFNDDAAFGNNVLPGAPRHLLHGELIWHLANGVYLGPTFDWVGARYVDFANQYKVSGHELLGVRAGVERGRWELFVEGRNLTDKDYVALVSVQETALATDAVLRPGAPVSIYAGLRIHY